MIAHTSVPVRDWPVVKAELLAASFDDIVKVHYLTHAPERVCLESRTPADLATVTDVTQNAVARHRTNLKKQLMSRRTPCRTRQSS